MRFTAHLMFGWRTTVADLNEAMKGKRTKWYDSFAEGMSDGWSMLLKSNGGPLDDDDMPQSWVQPVDCVNFDGDVVIGWPVFAGHEGEDGYELFDALELIRQVDSVSLEAVTLADEVYMHLMEDVPPTLAKTHLFCSVGESPELAPGAVEEG